MNMRNINGKQINLNKPVDRGEYALCYRVSPRKVAGVRKHHWEVCWYAQHQDDDTIFVVGGVEDSLWQTRPLIRRALKLAGERGILGKVTLAEVKSGS